MAHITSGEITWSEWLIQTNDISKLWEAQPTYMISQLIYILAGLLTLVHAFSKGGRWPYLWFATVIHGFNTDNFWHFILPEYDNFWHSPSPVMLLGSRLPLHILFVYPAFIYQAAYAVSRLNLPRYAEPLAVGLVTVLIDIPYDIVAVKFVQWTWHDTDPNVYDRHYWVPWNSYYFHATFAASFMYLFTASREWYAPRVSQWEAADKKSEWKSMMIASLVGMFGGVLLFVPIYHPLHDMLKIHSEVTFFVLFSIFMVFLFLGLLSEREKCNRRLTTLDYGLLAQLAVHYLTYWCFVVFLNPENERSLGLHEPVGPCNERTTLTTPFGQVLEKRKYFCPIDYNEDYFDFHCVPGGQKPMNGATRYLICGTPFANRAEYIVVISTILLVAVGVFYCLYFKTGQQDAPAKKLKKK